MPRTEVIRNSFNGGELSPYALGRTDLAKYHNSLEKCSNFIPMVQGGITRRWGTRYIEDAIGPSRLVPFIISDTQSYILEFGNQTLRFYVNDGQITSGGNPYQISTPYNTATDDLWDLRYEQIISVMYLVHPNHSPMKLIRISDTNWQLITPTFYGAPTFKFDQDVGTQYSANISISGSTVTASTEVFIAGDVGKAITAGTGVAYITAVGGSTTTDANTGATLYTQATITITDPFDSSSYTYGNWFLRGGPLAYFSVGSWNSGNNQWHTSRKFGFGKSINVRATTGHPADSTYQTVSGGAYVNVTYTSGFTDSFRTIDVGMYVPFAGGYGQITAVTNSTTVTVTVLSIPTITELDAYGNQMIAPTPPGGWYIESPAFTSTNGYPNSIAVFQDRLWFGGVSMIPNTFWASGTGDYENFALGTIDTSAIRITDNFGRFEHLRWLEPFQGNIVAGSNKGQTIISGGVGQVVASAGAPITPSNINITITSRYAVDRLQAIQIDNDLFYVEKSRTKLLELSFNAVISSYDSRNLTVLNEFITTSGFKEMSYQAIPFKIVWFVDYSGQLIGLTYDKQQDVWAWHRHNTGIDGPDSFISIATIPGSDGVSDETWVVCKRLRNGSYVYTIEILDDSLLVDCASHQIFTSPVASVSGLGYLEGRTVYANVDGILLPSQLITSSGVFTFPTAFSGLNVQIGLNYISEALTVRPEPRITVQGLIKRWLKIWARLYQTVGISIGTINNQDVPFRTTALSFNSAIPPFTGDVNINNLGYDRDGRVDIQQKNPLPITVLAIFGNLEVSDGI